MRSSASRSVLCALACGLAFWRRIAMRTIRVFPDLTRLDLKDEGVRVWYPKANAQPVTTPPAYLKEFDEAGVYVRRAAAARSRPRSAEARARVRFGAEQRSELPAAVEVRGSRRARSFESAGNDFVFLPTAEIYVFGETDYTYDHRRLFRFDGKHFAEVAQPFRYVGIEGKTKAPLALTAARNADAAQGDAKQMLATLAPETSITILLNAASGDNEIRPESGLPRADARGTRRLGAHSDAAGWHDDRRGTSLQRRLIDRRINDSVAESAEIVRTLTKRGCVRQSNARATPQRRGRARQPP